MVACFAITSHIQATSVMHISKSLVHARHAVASTMLLATYHSEHTRVIKKIETRTYCTH